MKNIDGIVDGIIATGIMLILEQLFIGEMIKNNLGHAVVLIGGIAILRLCFKYLRGDDGYYSLGNTLYIKTNNMLNNNGIKVTGNVDGSVLNTGNVYGDITITNGPKLKKLSDEHMTFILNNTDKNLPVRLQIDMGDIPKNYGEQIIVFLESKGYKDISGSLMDIRGMGIEAFINETINKNVVTVKSQL